MRFAAWAYFPLLCLVPALLVLYGYAFVRKRQALNAFADLALAPKLLPGYSRRRQWDKALCLIGAAGCLALALLQPQWGSSPLDMPRRGRDLIIALDVSLSMLAEDARPNRLQRSKAAIADLVEVIRQEGGHRLGLAAFAGRASLLCPLTLDYPFFLKRLAELGTNSVAREGTLIGDALQQILQDFGTLEPGYTDIILISDGEDHGSFPQEAAQAAALQQASLYTVGVGDPANGALIPQGETERGKSYVEYAGQAVYSRMQQSLLLELARLGHGMYWPAGTHALALDRLYRQEIAPKPRREVEAATDERLPHRYHGFVLAALLLLALEMLTRERRPHTTPGAQPRATRAGGLVPALAILAPTLAYAVSPYQAVRQGNAFYQAGQYAEASRHYASAGAALPDAAEIHFDHGNALYQQQQYRQALEHYTYALAGADPALASRIKYNLGNVAYQQALQARQSPQDALAQLGSAMAYYRDSLATDAAQADARYNLELAYRLRRQIEQQEAANQQSADQGRKPLQNQNQPSSGRKPQSQRAQSDPQPSRGQQSSQAAQDASPPMSGGAQTQQSPALAELKPQEAEQRLQVIRNRARQTDTLRQQWQRARMRDQRAAKYW